METQVKHRICFLGYSKLYSMAKAVLDEIPPSDVSYLLVDCDLDTQDDVVQEAVNAGCEVFIAGPGNSARFQTRFNLPLVEIRVNALDYAMSIRTAYESGCRRVAVVKHRHSASLNLEMIRKLLQTEVQVIEFENMQELFPAVRESECDGIVGPAGAVQAAEEAGKQGFLVYLGTDGIREACLEAANLARELWQARKDRAVTNAVMNTSQLGVIVTDSTGQVEFLNRVAQEYTGLLPSQVRGRQIREFFPNLSVSGLLKSEHHRRDSYRQVEGVMMRCVQEKVYARDETVGVVMTLYPEAHNRQRQKEKKTDFTSHIYQWSELTAYSAAMKTLITEGKALSARQEPTVIIGESGSGREEIAYCIHGGSDRSENPCITLDLATFPPQDAARILFGFMQDDRTVNGLLTDANGGSVVIKNISQAPPAALACLQQVLNSRQLFWPGMEKPVNLKLAFFTVCSPNELDTLSPDLRSQLSINQLQMPTLRNRKEDIVPLFVKYLSQLSDLPTRYAVTPQMELLLRQYSWPGNVWELRSVSMRYVIARGGLKQPTAKTRYNMLVRAIGEEQLFRDLFAAHPVLQQPTTDQAAFTEAFSSVKELMDYSNEQMAEKLGMGRTTLWRILRERPKG